MSRFLVEFYGDTADKKAFNRTALHRFKNIFKYNQCSTQNYLQEKIQVSTGKGYRLSVDFEF